ncbi:MAG: ATP-dependent DNA helicase RecG [Candidatus Hydrogenedentota bacterium]
MHAGDSIDGLDGIGPSFAERLANLGIETLNDLIHHFPRDYDDRRKLTPIGSVSEGDTVTVSGTVISSRMIRLRGRSNMAVVQIEDDSGPIKASWFGRGFLANSFQEGKTVVLSGDVSKYQGLCLKNPEYEILTGDDDDQLSTGRIVPIYCLTEKISQRMIRRWIATALEGIEDVPEQGLPETLRESYDYPTAREAIRAVHYPESMEQANRARDRLVYEELYALQIKILEDRKARVDAGDGIQHTVDGAVLDQFRKNLAFTLTQGQSGAVDDILGDMASSFPTRRLLQGDVGCGKTLVACHAMAAAVDGGYQVACMVPTEVLAEQHYKTLLEIFEPLRVPVALLTGASEDAAGTRDALARGAIKIVVGTHALIQKSTTFEKLGLVIVDEQHRFGVMQRQNLLGKGDSPDVIQMTATPIPRTLAITVYGGCDLSLIDELPPGRFPIKTSYVTPGKIPGMHDYVFQQVDAGHQAYIVCPLVEESETRAVKNVVDHYEVLSSGPFSELTTALLHGRMKSEEKESILTAFSNGDVQVLFSTSVIEVGIDCPNATIMIIEDASNFGLTQLHQLRGRVGRGKAQSHCFLVGKPKTKEGKQRIEALCATNDGFKIAEEDLKQRGSGELYGTRQSGMSDFRIADLVRDVRLLEQARNDAYLSFGEKER